MYFRFDEGQIYESENNKITVLLKIGTNRVFFFNVAAYAKRLAKTLVYSSPISQKVSLFESN